MTYCQTCDGGAYCSGSSSQACPSGYTSLPGSSECTIPLSCEPGFYQYAGRCTMCGKGSYCPDGINQMRCPEGTYGTKSSAKGFDEACAKCPAGTYNKYTGSSNISSCLECAAGVSTEGSGWCRNSCPAGTVRDGKACRNLPGCKNFANGACQECDADYLKNSEGTCTPEAECNNGLHKTADVACVANPSGCNTFAGNKCTECNSGLIKQEGTCVSSCGASFRLNDGECDRLRWTSAEAAQVLTDDNNNSVTITFKK